MCDNQAFNLQFLKQKKFLNLILHWEMDDTTFNLFGKRFFFIPNLHSSIANMGIIFFSLQPLNPLFTKIFLEFYYMNIEHQKEAKVYTIFFFKFFNKYFSYCLCEHFIFSVSNIIIFHLHFISLSVLAYLLVVIC